MATQTDEMATQTDEMLWWSEAGPPVTCLGSYALTKKGAENITLYQLSMAETAGLWPLPTPTPIPARILPLRPSVTV